MELIASGVGLITIAAASDVMLNGVTGGPKDIAALMKGVALRKYASDT